MEEARKSRNAGAASAGSDCGLYSYYLFPVLGMYIELKRKTSGKDAQLPNNRMI